MRWRHIAFGMCFLKALEQVEIYYGWSHARTLLDGAGYILFCAAVIYGVCAIYDRWRIVRRAKE